MFVQPFLLKKYYLFFQRKGAVVQRRNKVIVGGFLKVLRPKPFAAYKFVNTYAEFLLKAATAFQHRAYNCRSPNGKWFCWSHQAFLRAAPASSLYLFAGRQ